MTTTIRPVVFSYVTESPDYRWDGHELSVGDAAERSSTVGRGV